MQIIGKTIGGRFKVLSLLGEGGLGTVYKAEQAELNRFAAIKLIHQSSLSDPENLIRFEREAKILASITNEHIVSIYSFGQILPDELTESQSFTADSDSKPSIESRSRQAAGAPGANAPEVFLQPDSISDSLESDSKPSIESRSRQAAGAPGANAPEVFLQLDSISDILESDSEPSIESRSRQAAGAPGANAAEVFRQSDSGPESKPVLEFHSKSDRRTTDAGGTGSAGGSPAYGNAGVPYMAMEFVEGQTLAELLQSGPLAWKRCLDIGIQICSGLSAAHKVGIIHRDLKPQNIMLASAHRSSSVQASETDHVKILDFGLSKLTSASSEMDVQSLTQTGALIGSVHYMSPEICEGRRADERSDIYALGCILYECLAGRPPLDCDNAIGLLHKHRTELPKTLKTFPQLANIPEELELVIFKALQKNPEDRFQSMDDFKEALKLIAGGRSKELLLRDVRLSSHSRESRHQNHVKNLTPLILGFLLLVAICATAVSSSRFQSTSPSAKKLSKVEPGRVNLDRDKNIESARKMLAELKIAQAAGSKMQTSRLIQKILRTLGHPYQQDLLSRKYALEDLEILTQLRSLSEGMHSTHEEEQQEVIKTIISNDWNFLKPESYEFTLATARMHNIFGWEGDAIDLLKPEIEKALETKKFTHLVPLLDEYDLTQSDVRGESRFELKSDSTKFKIRMALGQNDLKKATALTKQFSDNIDTAFPIEHPRRLEELCYVIKFQDATKQISEAERSAKRISNQLRYRVANAMNQAFPTTLEQQYPSLGASDSALLFLYLVAKNCTNKEFKNAALKEQLALARSIEKDAPEEAGQTNIEYIKAKNRLKYVYHSVLEREPTPEEWANFYRVEKEKPFNFAEQMLALGKTDEFLSKLKNLDRDEQIQFLYHRILNRKADPMGLTGYRKLFEEKDTIRILMECLVYSGEFREHLKRLPFAEESVDLSNKGAASPAAAADVSKALSVIKSAEKSNKNARRDRPLHTHDEHGHLK